MLRHFLFRLLLVSGKLLACRVRVRHAGQLGGGHTKRGLPETNGSDDNAALSDAGGRYLSRGRATHYLRGRKASLKVIQKRLFVARAASCRISVPVAGRVSPSRPTYPTGRGLLIPRLPVASASADPAQIIFLAAILPRIAATILGRNLALKLHLGPQFDHPVSGNLEEGSGGFGVAEHPGEQFLTPAHHGRHAVTHDGFAAEEE